MTAPPPGSSLENIELDITHEVLIDRWERLAGWIAERGDDLRLERRLEADAEEWKSAGCPEGMLWRPPELKTLNELDARRGDDFTVIMRRFADASGRAWAKHLRQRLTLRIGAAATAFLLLGFATWATLAQRSAKSRLLDFWIEQGRIELLRGNYDRAAVYLSGAYSGGSRGPVLAYLLHAAMRPVDASTKMLGLKNCVFQSPDNSTFIDVEPGAALRIKTARSDTVLPFAMPVDRCGVM